jgi:hypothetical protein
MEMWTIYDHPRDYPTGYMARCWLITAGADPEPTDRIFHGSLAGVRGAIPPGLACLPRSPEDDPAVLETWL